MLLALLLLLASPLSAQQYFVYVANESDDSVSLVRFDADAGTTAVEKTIRVGVWPAEIEGPHGIAVDPSGDYWYLSLAHGTPYGSLLKFETGTDAQVGEVTLGLFPATMEVSAATGLLYVVNFNLHGDHVPSTISVVDPEVMVEVAQIPAGVMPHGSRVSADGTRQYSVSMMTDELYEVDAVSLEVLRRLNTVTGDPVPHAHSGAEHSGMDTKGGMSAHAGMDHATNAHGNGHAAMAAPQGKPTWAYPHPTEPFVYVANNGAAEIVEIDTEAWTITRRFATGKGPYNIEVTPDGRLLVATYKGDAGIGIWNLATGEEAARLPSARRVTHGVAISPDSRFAFVTSEGIGAEAGTLDVYDLVALKHVATAEVGLQAGGVAFWKMEDASR